MLSQPVRRDRVLALIAIFRLSKALLLILAGFGVLELLHPEVAAKVREWMSAYPFAIEYHVDRTFGSRNHIELAAGAAFAYAAVFTVEGIGLWLQKTWAEYFTIFVTSSFIPFEVLEAVRRTTVLRVGLVIANVAIVIYLVMKLWSARQHRLGGIAR